MLTVATYLWGSKYGPEDVLRLKRMVDRHMTVPHEFMVITDRPHLFDGVRIRVMPLDMTMHVPGTCFVRLFTFHPDGASIFGERILQIDLDTLIVGNLDAIASRDEDLVLWRNPSRVPWDTPDRAGRPYYNTSVVLHRCGTVPELWDEFRPKNPRCRDDQWWVSDLLGKAMPYFDGSDGIYRLGRPDTPGSGVMGELPANACIVTFPGSEGKWTQPEIAQANPWIAEHLAA